MNTASATWDFVKMLLATIMCGVVVSVVAAAVAILLAGDANASTTTAHQTSAPSTDAQPGVLSIIGNCAAETIEAAERDWNVTINGKDIDVRVMQSFIVPEGEASAATFRAMLPAGTRLLRLTVYTPTNIWPSRIFSANAHQKLVASDFKALSRKQLLIVQNDEGTISTDAILNISAGEAVTVEYTYQVPLGPPTAAAQTQSLMMSLANASDDVIQDTGPLGTRGTRGAVWVQWRGKMPSQISAVPAGATLETLGARITGLSWSSQQLNPNQRFHLAWTM
jgi:hypothetical protein